MAARATHGDVEAKYGLVLKARTDLAFSSDLDLKLVQKRFAAEPAVQRANERRHRPSPNPAHTPERGGRRRTRTQERRETERGLRSLPQILSPLPY